MDKWITGTDGGTYGGESNIAAAAASATVDILCDEGLIKNAQEMGMYLLKRLQDLQKTNPVLGDVRGQGLMVGIEFSLENGKPKR